MKKERKTILIGTLTIILLLICAFIIFYLVYNQTSDIKNNINQSTENKESENQTIPDQSNSKLDESEKYITIYLFRGNNCPHCERAIEFFRTLNYPYLKVVAYEIWNNGENFKLMSEVSKELEIAVSRSVPLIIIGNDYYLRGYNNGRNEEIKAEIEKSYQNTNYKDIVKKVLEDNSFNVTSEIII